MKCYSYHSKLKIELPYDPAYGLNEHEFEQTPGDNGGQRSLVGKENMTEQQQ